MIFEPGPHIRSNNSTTKIMADVIIALCPALIAGIWLFGIKSLYISLVSIGVCVLSEALTEIFLGRKLSISDLSAVVTGLLLALNMSSLTPLWVVAVAGVFSIVIVKQLFGGIGSNVVNPALMGRLFIMLVYPNKLMVYSEPLSDAISSASVLSGGNYELIDMIIGKIPGTIGETSVIALLIGFIWLIARGDIKIGVSAVYLAVTTALCTLLGADPLVTLFSGGLLLGGFFMLTDYPGMSVNNKLLAAAIAGVLTALIRMCTPLPEGVCYAILITNILSGLIDKIITPKIYGVSK